MATVRLENLEKKFGAATVLSDLNLTIREGEFFTFVGPSGCGKSTLLNLIAGLDEASAGKIFFDEQVVNPLPPRERDVAMVFQSYALYPHLSVRENIAFPLRMRKTPASEIAARVQEVAGLLGIEELLGRKPRELSGGQRQRVALGRALVRKPKVFLMDEPLSNLDARLRLEMRTEIKRLHLEFPITTIYVTHDQSEALTLSDRMAVISRGIIAQCGTPQEIYAGPADLFVAQFIGTPPMNILAAELAEGCLAIGSERLPLPERASSGAGMRAAVKAGIRPEDITLEPDRRSGTLVGTLILTEPVGPEVWVKFSWRGNVLCAKAPPDYRNAPGAEVPFRFRAQKFHLFDAESGQRRGGPQS
ncbi:MAG: ABC transporter ATP-binding protein [Candidatus Tectomicrobia bacterium]|uniref:ABC transporter ATP-binding protein n=1 Tax=Tectimicrobiota bacterium TaxID=2528274 RepID=A0A932M0M6_UNCTE|nr:ABC transporter ATP-binding protein [Candidatus Tectomicrobia bacterium]